VIFVDQRLEFRQALGDLPLNVVVPVLLTNRGTCNVTVPATISLEHVMEPGDLGTMCSTSEFLTTQAATIG
jgi:hypothetical protein